jgi:DNA-binding NarL/FixJ family response regulator
LVVLDPPTPGGTPLEAVLAIRARWPEPLRPAVVVISMDLEEGSRAALLAAGALDAIAEPPRLDRLREILAKSKQGG